MADSNYSQKILTRMKKVELLAVADSEHVNLGKLKKLTKKAIVNEIVVQFASRPTVVHGSIVNRRGLQGLVAPHEGTSVRIRRMREQNRERDTSA